MKVSEVMQKSVISVEENLPIKHVARLIYTGTTYSFPVVKGKKLVGFITEEDIFFGMYNPTNKDPYDEKNLLMLLEEPVGKIMVRSVITVMPETSLVDAQLLMYKHNFAQLPVIDRANNLVGIVTRASIFRHILEEQVPQLEENQYAEFITSHYDEMVDWEKRFDYEFPSLFRIFAKKEVKTLLELGIKTGEYAIELARNGLDVTGLGYNPLMIKAANSKKSRLPSDLQKRVRFKLTDFTNIDKIFPRESFDSAICLGGNLAYLPADTEKILQSVYKVLRKDGVLILQLLNLERIIEEKGRFYYFKINKEPEKSGKEELFVESFDKKDENTLRHNIINFTSDQDKWVYTGLNSVDVKYLKNNKIVPLVKKAGFKEVELTGSRGAYKGDYSHISLVKPFDPKTSEWMTVIAYV